MSVVSNPKPQVQYNNKKYMIWKWNLFSWRRQNWKFGLLQAEGGGEAVKITGKTFLTKTNDSRHTESSVSPLLYRDLNHTSTNLELLAF